VRRPHPEKKILKAGWRMPKELNLGQAAAIAASESQETGDTWLALSAPDEGFVTLVPTILPVGVYTGS